MTPPKVIGRIRGTGPAAALALCPHDVRKKAHFVLLLPLYRFYELFQRYLLNFDIAESFAPIQSRGRRCPPDIRAGLIHEAGESAGTQYPPDRPEDPDGHKRQLPPWEPESPQ